MMTRTSTRVAVAAAAAERHKEEEEMTRYTEQDLAEGWEFKIVRSYTSSFRNPQALRRLIEEEARAGWVMVEKFDDSRIRFKRPASARERDPMLEPGFDPYRTYYSGLSRSRSTVWLMLLLLGSTILMAVLIVATR